MNNKAMSLVEIIVAMLILAVAALLVSSTVMLARGKQMRTASSSATAGSMDIQATNYARETFEMLKNAVSTQVATGQAGAKLVDSSHGVNCSGSVVGVPCTGSTGTTYQDPLPDGDFKNNGGVRSYKVWDISDGNGNVAYKKVTVTVTWT